MIFVIIIIGSLIFVTSLYVMSKNNGKNNFKESFSYICALLGLIILVFSILCMCTNIINVLSGVALESKIQMYTEENEKIESQINTLVENYMKHEADTYKEFKPDDSIALVSLYPELKSDALVTQQITIYNENN